jgi:hypothetical protein
MALNLLQEKIKTLAGITGTTYDDKINIYTSMLVDHICKACRNDFWIKSRYVDTYLYETASMTFTATTITISTTLSLSANDFISICGSVYNDGMYQIKTIIAGVITIEPAKSLKAESTVATLVLCKLPDVFAEIIAKYIKNAITRDGVVSKEKIDDTEITYFKPADISSFVSDNMDVLCNYRRLIADDWDWRYESYDS